MFLNKKNTSVSRNMIASLFSFIEMNIKTPFVQGFVDELMGNLSLKFSSEDDKKFIKEDLPVLYGPYSKILT